MGRARAGFLDGRRLPFEPLAQAAGHPDDGTLATMLGTTRRTVLRWKAEGVPYVSADRAAVAVGRVDLEVWPDLLDLLDLEARAAYNARKAAAERARYRRPEVAERKRAASRRYYSETADVARAKERARYWADPEAARARRRERYRRKLEREAAGR